MRRAHTFTAPRHEDIVEVADDYGSIVVRIINDRLWHAGFRVGQESSEPVTVN
jgi:hypothetical protein